MLKILYIASCAFACCFVACTREDINKRYSTLNVRFLGDEEDTRMAAVEGEWNFASHTATLHATGDKFESFHLYLP